MPKKKIVTTEDQGDTMRVEEIAPAMPVQRVPLGVISLRRRFGTQAVIAVLVLALGVVSYLYITEKKTDVRGGISPAAFDLSPDKMDTEVSVEVLRAVSELMILPEEQDPIIATVADAERLQKEQAFYQYAENGDVLLVFPKSRQAVIYRPNVHKIVNVGPLIIDQNEP